MKTHRGVVFGCCHDFGDIMVWIFLINLIKFTVDENLGFPESRFTRSLGLLSPYWWRSEQTKLFLVHSKRAKGPHQIGFFLTRSPLFLKNKNTHCMAFVLYRIGEREKNGAREEKVLRELGGGKNMSERNAWGLIFHYLNVLNHYNGIVSCPWVGIGLNHINSLCSFSCVCLILWCAFVVGWKSQHKFISHTLPFGLDIVMEYILMVWV